MINRKRMKRVDNYQKRGYLEHKIVERGGLMLYENLNQRKKELGLTTEQLSQLSGVPVGTINKILSGETRSPRYDTLRALESVLYNPDSRDAAEPDSGRCIYDTAYNRTDSLWAKAGEEAYRNLRCAGFLY